MLDCVGRCYPVQSSRRNPRAPVFDALSDRLQDVFTKLRGHGRLSEDQVDSALREVRLALLEADVNFKECQANLAQGGVHLVLREPAMAPELGEHVLEAI